jgi:hypothetical protein
MGQSREKKAHGQREVTCEGLRYSDTVSALPNYFIVNNGGRTNKGRARHVKVIGIK